MKWVTEIYVEILNYERWEQMLGHWSRDKCVGRGRESLRSGRPSDWRETGGESSKSKRELYSLIEVRWAKLGTQR